MRRSILVTLPFAAGIGGLESFYADLRDFLPAYGWHVSAVAIAPTDRVAREKLATERPDLALLGEPWWRVADYAAATRREIERQRPDLVLSYAYDAPMFSGPNVPAGPRVIEGVHTGLPVECERIAAWQGYFDGMFGISDVTMRAIEEGLRGVPADRRPPVRRMEYGLRLPDDLPAAPPSDGSEPLRLLWFGRVLEKVKRVHDLVPLCDQLDRDGIHYQLRILGDGDGAPAIREKFVARLATGRVAMQPAVPAARVFETVADHDVFLSTSDFEGGPRTLIESMGCGVVPVVTDIEGYSRELVEDGVTGYRFPVGDVAAMAAHLRTLATERERLRSIGRAARAAVYPRFTIRRMCERIDGFFREVVDRPARREVIASCAGFSAVGVGPRFFLPRSVHRTLRRGLYELGLAKPIFR